MLRGPRKGPTGVGRGESEQGVALGMARKDEFPGYSKMNRKILVAGEWEKRGINVNPNFRLKE